MAKFLLQRKGFVKILLLVSLGASCGLVFAENAADSCSDRPYCLGTASQHGAFAAWDITVKPNGEGLPEGHGDAKTGKQVYAKQCAACHGENGKGGVKTNPNYSGFPALVSGDSVVPLASVDKWPTKTVGTYWPYATTVFDYIRRAMPFAAPQSLSNDDVYSVVAYLLAENKVIPADTVLTKANLAQISMPNRNGFTCDARPDTFSKRCMENCAVPGDPGFDAGTLVAAGTKTQSDCMVLP